MDHESPYLTTYPNAKKKVENMARTEVIVFKNFQVFGNVIKKKKRFLVLDAFRNPIKTKPKDKTEKYNSKNPNSVTVMIIINDV